MPEQLELFRAPRQTEWDYGGPGGDYDDGTVCNHPVLDRDCCYRLSANRVIYVQGITSIPNRQLPGKLRPGDNAWSHAYTVEVIETGDRYDQFERALLLRLQSTKKVRVPRSTIDEINERQRQRVANHAPDADAPHRE